MWGQIVFGAGYFILVTAVQLILAVVGVVIKSFRFYESKKGHFISFN